MIFNNFFNNQKLIRRKKMTEQKEQTEQTEQKEQENKTSYPASLCILYIINVVLGVGLVIYGVFLAYKINQLHRLAKTITTKTSSAKPITEKKSEALPYFKIEEEKVTPNYLEIAYNRYGHYNMFLPKTKARFTCEFSNGKVAEADITYDRWNYDDGYDGNLQDARIQVFFAEGEGFKIDKVRIYIRDKYSYTADCKNFDLTREVNSLDQEDLKICKEEQENARKWLEILEVNKRIQKHLAKFGDIEQVFSFPKVGPTKLKINVHNIEKPGFFITATLNEDDKGSYIARFEHRKAGVVMHCSENIIYKYQSELSIENNLGYYIYFMLDKNSKVVGVYPVVFDNTPCTIYICKKKKDKICERAQQAVDYWRGIMKWDVEIEKRWRGK
jgi:hypothetical protein